MAASTSSSRVVKAKTTGGRRKTKTASKKTKNKPDDSFDFYEVDTVLGRQTKNRKVYYKIRWKGFSAAHDTWEPEANLTNSALQEAKLFDKEAERAKKPKKQQRASSDKKKEPPKDRVKQSSSQKRQLESKSKRSRKAPGKDGSTRRSARTSQSGTKSTDGSKDEASKDVSDESSVAKARTPGKHTATTRPAKASQSGTKSTDGSKDEAPTDLSEESSVVEASELVMNLKKSDKKSPGDSIGPASKHTATASTGPASQKGPITVTPQETKDSMKQAKSPISSVRPAAASLLALKAAPATAKKRTQKSSGRGKKRKKTATANPSDVQRNAVAAAAAAAASTMRQRGVPPFPPFIVPPFPSRYLPQQFFCQAHAHEPLSTQALPHWPFTARALPQPFPGRPVAPPFLGRPAPPQPSPILANHPPANPLDRPPPQQPAQQQNEPGAPTFLTQQIKVPAELGPGRRMLVITPKGKAIWVYVPTDVTPGSIIPIQIALPPP